MTRWLDRAEQLTYEGEEIAESVDVGEGGVVVTTHRVLVFSPASDGQTFAHVDLPNVDGVDRVEAGEERLLLTGAKAGTVGAILLVAGAVLPLDSIVGDVDFGQGASRIGLGGVVSVIETVLTVLRNLDTALFVLGALSLLVAAGALGWYLHTRERVLQVDRAGDEPLTLPIGEGSLPEGTLDRLRRAVDPGDA